jgi:BolA family transcriptional regulator, general stress-responsive regulator
LSANRLERIRTSLQTGIEPEQLDLADDSHLHAGHAGARDGRGHFRVYIVSRQFATMRPLQRHQLVYRTLGDLMNTDIHALSISAFTPDEAQSRQSGLINPR